MKSENSALLPQKPLIFLALSTAHTAIDGRRPPSIRTPLDSEAQAHVPGGRISTSLRNRGVVGLTNRTPQAVL